MVQGGLGLALGSEAAAGWRDARTQRCAAP